MFIKPVSHVYRIFIKDTDMFTNMLGHRKDSVNLTEIIQNLFSRHSGIKSEISNNKVPR